MTASPRARSLDRLVQLLVDGADDEVLDRILLDAVSSLEAAESLALWRADAAGAWYRAETREGARELPGADELERHLSGEAPLPEDVRVLSGESGDAGEPSVLLVLAGVRDAGALESARTLLEISARHRRSEARDDSGAAASWDVDAPPAALPAERLVGDDRRLAHDLRNHLAGLRTVCDVLHALGQELEEDERDHFGSVLVRECRRAGELLASVLEPEHPDGAPASELLEALRDVIAAEEAACTSANAELEVRIEEGPRDTRYAISAVDLGRVLRNLLVNVREACATPAGPAVRVLVEAQPEKTGRGGLVLSVEDDGPGVAPRLRPRLFEAGVSTKGGRDTGFGLSGVRSLVERAGGEIRVQHLPVRGSRFQLWIPETPGV